MPTPSGQAMTSLKVRINGYSDSMGNAAF